MNIDKKLEEFDEIIGNPPPTIEFTKDKTCFICGQPFDKAPQVKDLRDFLRQALEQQQADLIKKIEKMEMSTRGGSGDWYDGRSEGWNDCLDDIINLIKEG